MQQFTRRAFQLLILTGFLALNSFNAFAQQTKIIGSVSSFQKLLSSSSAMANARVSGITLQGPTQNFSANVNAIYNNAGYQTYAGKVLEHGRAEFHIQFKDAKAEGLIVLFDEKKAYEFTTDVSGNVVVKEKSFEKTISVDHFSTKATSSNALPAAAGTPGTTADGTVIPLYQSNAAASTVLYLDFDGEYVANTPWNGGVPIDAAKPNGSAGNITTIWEMVSEDYAPFNLNVTTDRAVYNATPAGRRQMIIFTPTNTAAPGAGGVAFISGFSWQPDLPCWVFVSPTEDANSAEAASHETGHTFGLLHDGRDLPQGHEEYYEGHANWAPIMGVAYGKAVSQFSKGEYANASTTEDDLSIISSTINGFGFKNDDHGSTASTATLVSFNNNMFSVAGLIGTTSDKDYFKFTVPGGTATINANKKYSANSNLNMLLQVFNSNQQLVAESNPSDALTASLTNISLAPGDYYIAIDGVGEGDATTGYTDYGSLGEYVISASFSPANYSCTDPAWNAATAYSGGAKVSFNGNKYTAKWWTQGNQPDLNVGEGKPWSLTGTCGVQNVAPIIAISSSLQGQIFYEYPSDGRKIDVTLSQFNSTEAPIDSVKYIVVDTQCNGPGCATVRKFTVKNTPFGLTIDPIYTLYATTNNAVNTEINAIAFSKGIASEQKTIYVKVKPLPEVTFVAPLNNTVVSRTASKIAIDVNVNSNQIAIDSVVYTVYDTKTTGMSGVTTTRKFVIRTPYDFDLPVIAGNTFTRIFALAYGDGGKFSKSAQVQVNYNNLPTIVITAPSAGSKFNVGGSVTVKANVSDTDGTIAKVEIYSPHIPNSTITLTAPPYEATFSNLESSGIRGATSFVVKATDNQGGVNGVSIDVLENKAPIITITSPLPQYNNSNIVYVVGGSLTVAATATDNDGTVTKVEISRGGGNTVTLTAAPYTATFTNLPAPAPDGSIYFNVKAYDNEGGVSTKLIIAYKNRLPFVAITSPANNTSFSLGAAINIATAVSDVDGAIAKVEFFDGATKLGQTTVAPFSFVFNNATVGVHAITIKATDNLGESATSSVVNISVSNNTCTVAAWNVATAYSTSTRVSKNGTVYEAKWWSQGVDPVTHSGLYDEWKVIGPCNARLAAEESLSGVSLMPVPFEAELFVSLTEQSTIVLFDMYGQKLVETEGNNKVVINTANLAAGIYICKVTTNGVSKSFTVLKK